VEQGSLIYRDDRYRGFDAAAVVEVIEHMEPDRLESFELALFGNAKPGTILVTTPNISYNACFSGLAAGRLCVSGGPVHSSNEIRQYYDGGAVARRIAPFSGAFHEGG